MPIERDGIKQLNVNISQHDWERLALLPYGYKQQLVNRFIKDLVELMLRADSPIQLNTLLSSLIKGRIGLARGADHIEEILDANR